MVMQTVSLIVPCHRCDENLRSALASIAALQPKPYEVIVVADADVRRIASLARGFGFSFLNTATQSGPAAARNLGATIATGTLLFFVDSDVIISPDSIQRITHEFQKFPDVSAIVGSYDDDPSATNFISQYKNLFHHFTHQTAVEQCDTFWGACGAICRDVFHSVNGFDEFYKRPCVEDIELGYRLSKAGYQIRICKELQIKHLKRWSIKSLFTTDFFDRALPWADLILRDKRCHDNLNISNKNRVKVSLVFSSLLTVGLGVAYWPNALFATFFFVVLLLVIDFPLFHFFRTKRGSGFAFRAMAWQCFYYVYCGIAYAIGVITQSTQSEIMTVTASKQIIDSVST